MSIALFSNTVDPRDGYGNITVELCTHLHARGRSFTLFLPRSQAAGASALPFPTRCVLPEYIYRVFQRKVLGYLGTVDVSGFDLVHDLFAFPYCIIAERSARKHNKPFIIGAQGTHGVRPLTFFPEKLLLKRCYRAAKAIHVPSVYTKEKIQEYAGEQYPIRVIHNGVNYARFQKQLDPSPLRAKHAGKTILLTVGGLWGRKGHDLVLRALADVVREKKDIVYVIVGDGNARPGLEQLTHELGLRDHVEFAGRLGGDDVVRAFQSCDIYVHTPKVIDLKFEGFGIVYLEASACGKPIVATDAGGVRDAVLDGETGLIAGDGDVPGIARSILRLCEDSALRERLGSAGKRYAERHDWSIIAEQFDQLYREIHA